MGSSMSPSLSDLPNHVVDDILVRLSLREAVRTSVLSRAWRHRWHSIPELVFDDPELPPAAIDNVLLLHSAPVRRFSLLTFHTDHAHRWIHSLSRRAAGHLLSLNLSFIPHRPLSRPLHPLHSSVFSFRETLTHLRLFRCSLSLPPHPHCSFPALRSLHLQSVKFPDDRQLSVLISGCPALEHLSLLAVRPCGSLRVHSPNLRSFELCAHCDRVELMSDQTLHLLRIDLLREDTDVELAELFRGVVCKDQLCLQECTTEALAKGSIPESVVTSFQRLRSLSISVSLDDPSQISVMLCLMRSAPNLQELFLVGRYAYDATGPGEDFWIAIQSLELFASLRTVDIVHIMIQEPDMQFMRFILARAPVLETLTIIPKETTRYHESALTELRKLHRRSTRAQIIYVDLEEDGTED